MTLAYRPYVEWKMACRDSNFDDLVSGTFDALKFLGGLIDIIIRLGLVILFTIIGFIGLIC
jgi:hypothetical protein